MSFGVREKGIKASIAGKATAVSPVNLEDKNPFPSKTDFRLNIQLKHPKGSTASALSKISF